ncbi:MAG: response regulator [Candidatus Omnitrophota bacterium]
MAMQKRKMLVIEDDSIMGMEMKEVLEEFGYEVSDIVSSGEAAIKAVKLYRPDLVLMDIRLKGDMSGIEAARKMRAFTSAPITFLTGYRSDGTVKDIRSIPCTYLLTKPIDFDKLNSTLQEALGSAI